MSFIAPLLLVLAVSLFTIFLIIGLVSVPWPVLALILLLGLMVTQRVLQRCRVDFDAPS